MFHRSQRLFLRPPFPEDRDVILALLGDLARAEAMVLGRRGRHFVLALPGQNGAPVIGAASFLQGDEGMEICVKIAEAFMGAGYGAEAARALSEIAVALGYGQLPRRSATAAPPRSDACEDGSPPGWIGAAAQPGSSPKAAA